MTMFPVEVADEETVEESVAGSRPHGRFSVARRTFDAIWRQDLMAKIGLVILGGFILIGIFGPAIAPYDAFETVRTSDGSMNRLSAPSAGHPLGTSYFGHDIYSQVVLGTRVALVVGFSAALAVGFISTVLGLVSGYFGGLIDDVITRIVDIVLSIPTLPFAIVLVAIAGPSLKTIIIVIVALYWRNGVRIFRSVVLSQRERLYIQASRSAGASHFHIIIFHILPNVLPIVFPWVASGLGYAVLAEATLSFLGLGDPAEISWGQILNTSFTTGSIRDAWWTVLAPSICLALLITSVYSVGREYEERANPRLRRLRRGRRAGP